MHQAVWNNAYVLHFYLEGTGFDSRLGRQLSWIRFLWPRQYTPSKHRKRFL